MKPKASNLSRQNRNSAVVVTSQTIKKRTWTRPLGVLPRSVDKKNAKEKKSKGLKRKPSEKRRNVSANSRKQQTMSHVLRPPAIRKVVKRLLRVKMILSSIS